MFWASGKPYALSWRIKAASVALLSLFASVSFALGPHEVVLVVNDESLDSILLGRVYQRLRAVPERNVIRVSLPAEVYSGVSTDITPQNFTKYIWEPLTAKIDEAGIRHQILACVYSCGFPTRVTTDPAVSITGLTFTRNQVPSKEDIGSGKYVSEIFAGPANNQASLEASATFDQMRNRLLEGMPLPSMMLAFTGERGMTVDEAVAALERSAAADQTAPKGTFFLAVNDDVRSTCRHWQYEGAAEAIRRFPGQIAVVSTNMPTTADFPLCGFMTGNRTAPTAELTFSPGAFADNLTSFGAAFDMADHTKATSWLKGGAAFSAGTVVEPYAIWSKFPSAFIFVHSLAGCTAIESFYQSVLSPLQILPLGDPLSRPWAPKLEPEIAIKGETASGMVEMQASVKNEALGVFLRFTWLVDGRVVATGRTFMWDTRNVEKGAHHVRVVVSRQLESARHQDFVEIAVNTGNGGVNEK